MIDIINHTQTQVNIRKKISPYNHPNKADFWIKNELATGDNCPCHLSQIYCKKKLVTNGGKLKIEFQP